jgi:hypothetical protein
VRNLSNTVPGLKNPAQKFNYQGIEFAA